MPDLLKRYMHESFKVAIVETTQLGRALYHKVHPSPIGLQLLTQGMTGTLLMASGLKDEGSLLLVARGTGPGESLTIEANTAGNVRGTMANPQIQFQPKPDLGLFQQTIGTGTLSVTRRTRKTPKPYQSVIHMVKGEIAINLAHYLLQSDQTQSALQLGTTLHPELGIDGSGGIMIQALPGADENILFILEQRLGELAQLGEIFATGKGQQELINQLFQDLEIQHMTDSPVRYYCPCSRVRMMQILSRIPRKDLMEMHAENKTQVLTCSFCNQGYDILPVDLEVLMDQAKT